MSWVGPGDTTAAFDLRGTGTAGGLGLFYTETDPSGLRGVHVVLGDDPQGALKPATIQALNQELGRAVTGTRLDAICFDIATRLAAPARGQRQRPLMPGTKDPRLKFSLGPLFVAEQFDIELHPHKQQVIDVLHEIYKAARARDQARGSDRYRRVLTGWQEKYRGIRYRDIQKNLPDEKPLPRQTTITDNFNRANQSGLGSSSEGFSWTEVGNWSISSNTALTGSGGDQSARADEDLSTDDHYSEATCTAGSGGSYRDIGVAARYDSSLTSFYAYIVSNAGSSIFVKMDNGFASTLKTETGSDTPSSSLMRIEVDGSNLEGFFESNSRITHSDSSFTGDLRCGLRCFRNGNVWDDFEAGDISAATTVTVSASFNAALQKQQSLSASVNAALQAEGSDTVGLTAALQAGRAEAANVDAALSKALFATANLNAALLAERQGSGSLTAAAAARRVVSANLDAALLSAQSLATSLDLAAQVERTAVLGLSANLTSSSSIVTSLTAALRSAVSLEVGLSAALQEAGLARQASLSAALAQARSITVSCDAALAMAGAVTTGIQALISASVEAGAGIGAYIVTGAQPFRTHASRRLKAQSDRRITCPSSGRRIIVPPSNRRH